jgi:hypothetical protein
VRLRGSALESRWWRRAREPCGLGDDPAAQPLQQPLDR